MALSSVVALSGVVLQQVSQHLGGGQIVDGNNLEALSAEHLTESQTADTAKTVNCNFDRHGNSSIFITAFGSKFTFLCTHSISPYGFMIPYPSSVVNC